MHLIFNWLYWLIDNCLLDFRCPSLIPTLLPFRHTSSAIDWIVCSFNSNSLATNKRCRTIMWPLMASGDDFNAFFPVPYQTQSFLLFVSPLSWTCYLLIWKGRGVLCVYTYVYVNASASFPPFILSIIHVRIYLSIYLSGCSHPV